VVTVVVSGATAFAAAPLLKPAVIARGCEETVAGSGDTAACVDDAAPLNVLLESLDTVLRAAGLADGNNNWETAMAMSDRNKAKKKRLSIQGTGS
jgi:hypothetical protein